MDKVDVSSLSVFLTSFLVVDVVVDGDSQVWPRTIRWSTFSHLNQSVLVHLGAFWSEAARNGAKHDWNQYYRKHDKSACCGI